MSYVLKRKNTMIDVRLLEKYISSGLNILVTGEAGTGKTTMIQSAAKNLGWNMKYYSTSTLDPFADLLGIPVPNMGRQTVDYFRPRELDNADIVFFDELNRADIMVLNAVFEIVQFKSINGEKLDKLKCVVAAINPVSSGYATRELDIALRDRFDLFLESAPEPSWEYFRGRYGEQYARVGFELYQEYLDRRRDENLDYFSPRRLDKMLAIFQTFPVIDTLKGVVPSHGSIDFDDWSQRLKGNGSVITIVAAELEERIGPTRKAIKGNFGHSDNAKKEILEVYKMVKVVQHSIWSQFKRELAVALNKNIAGPEDLNYWSPILEDFSPEDWTFLTKDWPTSKALAAAQAVGEN